MVTRCKGTSRAHPARLFSVKNIKNINRQVSKTATDKRAEQRASARADGNDYTIEFEYTLEVDEMATIMEEMRSDLHLSVMDVHNIADQISCELDRCAALLFYPLSTHAVHHD